MLNFVEAAIGNVVDAGKGFVDGLTGASRQKREQAKRRQKEAAKQRRAADERAKAAQRDLKKTVQRTQNVDRMQNQRISAAANLASRSMSTARSAAFQSEALQGLVRGIRADLKALAGSSASAEALKEANETLAKLASEVEELEEAQAEYRASTDEAISALNEEAANTTSHLEALTKKPGGGSLQSLATDVLPWARIALAALNVERPTNTAAYYLYLASGPFLRGREDLDPVFAELITTGLQVMAYWDNDGIEGLFRSRPALPVQTQDEIVKLRESVKELQGFLNRKEVREALDAAGVTPPLTRR